jgi:predicted DNA-binding transcriptional regulator AlpA
MEAKIEERLSWIEATLSAPSKEYLDVPQTAEFMGMSKVTLDLWRSKGGGPDYHKVGRKVLYSVADLRAFMASNRVEAMR